MGALQVGVASAHGAPGVSTLALALGVVSSDLGPGVVAELDPWGADLSYRLGLGLEPGLGTLAAARRHGLDGGSLAEHSRPLVGGLRLLAGRPGRAGSAQTVGLVGKELPSAARVAGVAGWWDLGRLDEGSPAWPAALAVDVVVLVAAPTAPGLAHVLPLAERLASSGAAVAAVLSAAGLGRRGYREAEVAAALDGRGSAMALAGRLPDDRLGVTLLERCAPRWASRTALGQAARRVAGELGGLEGLARVGS
jgi:hypothetical protein